MMGSIAWDQSLGCTIAAPTSGYSGSSNNTNTGDGAVTSSSDSNNNGSNSMENNNNNNNGTVKNLAKGADAHAIKLLPEDYRLGDDDVICGRGSRCFNHIGNKRFRAIVESHLDRYSNTSCKFDKTAIICEVVSIVREISPKGGFVKKDNTTGRYYEVGDFLAVSFLFVLSFYG